MKQIQNKKAMVNQMQVIGIGIIALILIVGIGMTVLTKLGGSIAVCGNSVGGGTYNSTDDQCYNTSGTATDPSNAGWSAINYGRTQISSTGLLSWLPAIIALLVGVWFLSYFAGKKDGGKEY